MHTISHLCRRIRGYLYPPRWRAFHFEKKGHRLTLIQLGEMGERIACAHLRSMGIKILYRNFRATQGGEVDIVARQGDTLRFIEVKTRRKREGSRPLDAVNQEKQRLVEKGAREWIRLLGRDDFLWRFDVMEVIVEENQRPHLVWVQEAF